MKTKRHPGCGDLITIGWLHPDPEPQMGEGKQMDDNSQPVA